MAARGQSSLRELARRSSWEKVLEVLQHTKQRHATSVSITEAGGSSHWQEALFLWCNRISKTEKREKASTTNALVAALGRALQWEMANEMVLGKDVAWEVGVEGYSSALFTSGQVSAWHHSLALLREMHLKRLPHNSRHWSAAVSACGKCFMWEHALDLISYAGDLPEDFTSAILKALQASHQWEQALLFCTLLGRYDLNLLAESCQHAHAWEAALSIGAPEAAMRASAAASEWQQTLALFHQSHTAVSDKCDSTTAYTVLSALVKVMRWQQALGFFETFAEPSALKRGETRRHLIRAWGAGHHWREALSFLREDPWAVSAAVWACQAAGQEEVTGELLSQCFEVEKKHRPNKKELQLLDHLQSSKDTFKDAADILNSIENFAKANQWLKVAGDEKRKVFQSVIKPGDRVLELGTYVGFSALLLALKGCQVTTIEADPFNAAVAQRVLELAGCDASERVKICVGRAADWLSLGSLEAVDVLILDHRGTIYHEDLRMAEHLLRPGARVIADNVLHPGAPLFVHDVRSRYEIEVHVLEEFGMPGIEDWLFVCRPKSWPLPFVTLGLSPPDLRRWNVEVNKRCHESQLGPVDWQDLQQRLRPVLCKMLEGTDVSWIQKDLTR